MQIKSLLHADPLASNNADLSGHALIRSLAHLASARRSGWQAGLVALKLAVRACQRDNQWMRAMSLLGLAQQQRLLVDVVTFTTVLSACGKASKWDVSLDLLFSMRRCFDARTLGIKIYS